MLAEPRSHKLVLQRCEKAPVLSLKLWMFEAMKCLEKGLLYLAFRATMNAGGEHTHVD